MRKVRSSMRNSGWATRSALALCVILLAAVPAGCGSSGGDSTTASTTQSSTTPEPESGGGSKGLEEGIAAAEEFAEVPTEFGITTPTAKPIPAGKTIAFINCGVPACEIFADGIKKAAEVLEWNFKNIATDGSPASVKAGWATAVQDHVNAVIGSGYDTQIYASELKQLQEQGAFVGNASTTDPGPTGNVDMRIAGPEEVAPQGEQLAAWITKETNGEAKTLYVNVPEFPILAPILEAFEQRYSEWCEGCEMETMDLPLASLGTDSVTKIVSYLRAHPEINFVAASVDGAVVGLPAALKAAGLNDVTIGGMAPTTVNLGYVETGEESATVTFGNYEMMAALVDGAARFLTGQSLKPSLEFEVPFWLITKENVTPEFKPAVPDLYGKLAKLWGKN